MSDSENMIKAQRFHGKASDNYNLWCCSAESALDGKGLLMKLANEENRKPDLEAAENRRNCHRRSG